MGDRPENPAPPAHAATHARPRSSTAIKRSRVAAVGILLSVLVLARVILDVAVKHLDLHWAWLTLAVTAVLGIAVSGMILRRHRRHVKFMLEGFRWIAPGTRLTKLDWLTGFLWLPALVASAFSGLVIGVAIWMILPINDPLGTYGYPDPAPVFIAWTYGGAVVGALLFMTLGRLPKGRVWQLRRLFILAGPAVWLLGTAYCWSLLEIAQQEWNALAGPADEPQLVHIPAELSAYEPCMELIAEAQKKDVDRDDRILRLIALLCRPFMLPTALPLGQALPRDQEVGLELVKELQDEVQTRCDSGDPKAAVQPCLATFRLLRLHAKYGSRSGLWSYPRVFDLMGRSVSQFSRVSNEVDRAEVAQELMRWRVDHMMRKEATRILGQELNELDTGGSQMIMWANWGPLDRGEYRALPYGDLVTSLMHKTIFQPWGKARFISESSSGLFGVKNTFGPRREPPAPGSHDPGQPTNRLNQFSLMMEGHGSEVTNENWRATYVEVQHEIDDAIISARIEDFHQRHNRYPDTLREIDYCPTSTLSVPPDYKLVDEYPRW